MRARIAAEGYGAQADLFPDGTLVLAIIDQHGHQICQGVWHQSAAEAEVEPQQSWPPQRQSA